MTKRTKRMAMLFAAFWVCCFLLVSISFSQEIPKPGEVIDKNNYKKYAHLFPEEILPGFENGFGGFWKPFVIKVVENKPASQPKAFLALSEKNRGKYTLDKDGFIAGGYDYEGLPFPGVTSDDKDFATKFMYNYNYRYIWEDSVGPARDAEKRKGEPVTSIEFDQESISFIGRLITPPKPFYKNPAGLQFAQVLAYTYPSSYRGMILLTYKYLDQKKSDEVYMYLPTMRRVLRGDASQRSTPIQGTTNAFDDFNGGFEGKVQQFTYKFVGQRKVLGCLTSPFNIPMSKKLQAEGGGTLPFASENFEVRDTYVIEIKAKDPKYPQSRKIIYVDKDTLMILYGVAWDRAGKLWKVWLTNYRTYELPNGDKANTNVGQLGIDVQVGFATFFTMDNKMVGNNLKYVDVMPSNLSKKAR